MTGAPLDWDTYAVQWAGSHGGVDPRRTGGFTYGWLRLAYKLGRTGVRLGIRPAAVTVLGLVLSLAVPALAGAGQWWVLAAAALVLLAALADTVDGAVAVIGGRTSRLGYVYDSLADRLAEVAWLAGLKLVGVPAWLCLVVGGLGWLHEYVRARATTAGMSDIGVITAGERPTRVVFAFLGLALGCVGGAISPPLRAGTATAATAIWTLFALVGMVQLLSTVNVRLRGRRPPRYVEADPQRLNFKPGRGAGGAMSGSRPSRGPEDRPASTDAAEGGAGGILSTNHSIRPDGR